MDGAEINRIRDQFQGGLWPQFLERVDIAGLRGWKGQSVQFKFPVVALVGENGAGKSTLLKAAAAAYDKTGDMGYFPSDFFLDTHWDTLAGITLGYVVKTGEKTTEFSIRKRTKRWSFPEKRISRGIYWFDVARTLPLDATAGYAKVARLAAGEISTKALSDEFRGHLSHVLNRDYTNARFAAPDVSEKRPVGLLQREFGEISQFHQGAGEDTTLDLMRALQEVPKNALVIIDEVEASLHPRAQRRLINFLLKLSRERRVQIIVSTHSPYVLEELPPEARVLLLPTSEGPSVLYGASPEFALTKLDEIVHPEAFLYVEDRSAEVWLREIIARHGDGAAILSRIKISSVGPANVVKMMGDLAAGGKLSHAGIGVLDGDQPESPGCVRMPGTDAPERVVFTDLKQKNWGSLHERFGIGAGDLHTYLDDAVKTPDFHRWPAYVGDRVVKSSASVWETMATEWCRLCLTAEDRDRIIAAIATVLPGGV
ncbi:ATP-dependent endonuclease [Massilia sp. LC238]|uniref:ATP-dependent nuclease n=1 Tax=Massilia sp. LC238 TaxID=1502852 RepID=UPI0004E43E77|nr:ATP-binding protein [Massilia sp. LC238]KFC65510.1 hemin importer ATP-binding subunit [Massilia sp. LC238]